MNTTKALISIVIIFGLFVLSHLLFKNKDMLPLLTTIFVAIIALISNQYGIYQNKKYEIKFFSIKKRIEDIESFINRLEKLHSGFFELFQQYLTYFFDVNIHNEVIYGNKSSKILFDKFSEVSAISFKVGQLYWSNYSVLSNQTKELFSQLSESISINNLNNYWFEIDSNKAIVQDQEAMKILDEKYTKPFNEASIKYSSSIMEYIYYLKDQKEKLLNELS